MAKLGDLLGVDNLREAGGLGKVDGGRSALGRGSTLGSGAGRGGKSEVGGGIGGFLGEATTSRGHVTIKLFFVTMVVSRGERWGCCGGWGSGGVVWWPTGRGLVVRGVAS